MTPPGSLYANVRGLRPVRRSMFGQRLSPRWARRSAVVLGAANQFPRAVDLARPFLGAGMKVCICGFHVSGCVAMLPAAPILPRKHVRRVSGELSSLDLGPGCSYQCSFCTIINVQGRKTRFRSRRS
jgi:hypothetical protein